MFKNLKSLFIVPEEEQVNVAETENNSNEKVSEEKARIVEPTNFEPKGKVDSSILDKLFEALEDNNQQGFDYLEFRKAILTLKALPMDEATKYQSTFATAATMGVTLNKLLDSIEFYKKVLLKEEDVFTKAIKEQTIINVNDKVAEKDKITATIANKAEQIKKLTEEIQLHQTEIVKLTSSIEVAESKIKETSMNFESSIKIIKDQLDNDYEKLKLYIK